LHQQRSESIDAAAAAGSVRAQGLQQITRHIRQAPYRFEDQTVGSSSASMVIRLGALHGDPQIDK
jgi:hypothetical protein